MLATPLGRLRFIGIFEAASFLILLLIAMPLKYFADLPQGVTVVGMAHGVLFTLYLLAVLNALLARKLSWLMAALAVVAAFLPFGPLILDRKIQN
ncbi:DUF3817 domain-containing protein [Cohnella boryungensis]|jgi:integral membrane protein|uniref:DUF3817 domain-containing protein n=1 Tax=Cohnella boryungensis TaxID=768479 RepID=A0ABV8S2Y3_9BACL